LILDFLHFHRAEALARGGCITGVLEEYKLIVLPVHGVVKDVDDAAFEVLRNVTTFNDLLGRAVEGVTLLDRAADLAIVNADAQYGVDNEECDGQAERGEEETDRTGAIATVLGLRLSCDFIIEFDCIEWFTRSLDLNGLKGEQIVGISWLFVD
jgi:hypothetical protein